MYFKQFYLKCLAHASYLIGSEGEAAVIDPQRDVDQYIEEAEAQGLKIRYIIETHLHADFVSGHRELAARTGAQIVFSEKAGAAFPHRAVKDGDQLTIGAVRLSVLETPGHTPESICVLVTDDEGNADEDAGAPSTQKLLTGDTLFVGDVGRPDLAGALGYTPQAMAAMMYDSLHEKLLKLPDETEVYPAHGAGSMCGKSLSNETSSTIGAQRKFNYALQPMSKEDFVRMMTADLPEAPQYFFQDAQINRSGANALSDLPAIPPLNPTEITKLAAEGHLILDVRPAPEFGASHIPGALNIGLGGQFASWAGSLVPIETPIVIVADSDERVAEARMRLARVGLENVKGFLSGGTEAWRNAGLKTEAVPQITVADLKNLIETQPALQVIDVRRPAEYQSGHAPRAITAPLSSLQQILPLLRLDSSRPTAVICAGGYRSSAATSIMQRAGFINLLNVTGGTKAWIDAGYEVEMPAAAATSN